MKIIEQFLCGKEGNLSTCEDGLIIGKHLIAVLDGVTSKGIHLWNGKTSGFHAKEVLSDYLRQDVEKQSAIELMRNLDRILHDNIESAENLASEEYPRAVIIIYNDFYKEVWSYGDCQCRINEDIYTHSKKIDELNADLRAFYLEYLISQGADIKELEQNDLGRKGIQRNLIMQFAFENKLGCFGYPVLNGMGIEESMIKCYSVTEGDTVILASDGYPVLRKTLKECENELDYIRQNDPMCFRLFRSTKGIKQGNASFDDRAFCKFIV
ncbi:MAG: hypothetical protein HFH83_08435 [Lachnospiraceae bacterium]|nr:hypothetical protein [Lachnospiraceae bacterium]